MLPIFVVAFVASIIPDEFMSDRKVEKSFLFVMLLVEKLKSLYMISEIALG